MSSTGQIAPRQSFHRIPSPTTEARRAIIGARRWAGGLVLAFVAVAALTGLGAIDGIDEGSRASRSRSASEPLDLPASIFNVVGQLEVTALIALILSFVWWRRRGARGPCRCCSSPAWPSR